MNLKEAIESVDLLETKRLLEENPALVDELCADRVPHSFRAALTGDLALVRYIVEYSRASLNAVDAGHKNILHYATMSGSLSVVEYLVRRCGMDPCMADKQLVTPYEIAYVNKNVEILDFYQEVCGFKYEEAYKNPIRQGFFPDPSIVRVEDDYYMANSSFIFFPCIPISHSKDLVNWKIIGYAITNPDWAYFDELEGGRGYWAPDISYDNGTFYVTATYRLNDDGMPYRKQIVVSSTNPAGPYSEPVFIDEDGIDPSIFHEDGKHYMLLNRGARIFELNEDCTKQVSEATMLFYGDMKRAPEGSHLLKKDGWYYLFEAEGGTGLGHRITVSRSRELLGFYEPCPYNPIMRQEDYEAAITRCGHGKPVSTPDGRWYMVYLCGRMFEDKYTFLGRETALDEITWTADEWPIVNMRKGPGYLRKLPFPELKEQNNSKVEKFDKLDYFTPRPPVGKGIVVDGDKVELEATTAPLSEVAARNIYLRRQTSFDMCFLTKLDCQSLEKEGNEAGLICYYDENTWVSAYIRKQWEGFELGVTEHIGHDDVVHEPVFVEKLVAPTLSVVTHGLVRDFAITEGDSILFQQQCSNVTYLCDEGIAMGKRFTGACVGVYAYGKEAYMARFEGLSYTNLVK